MLSTNNAESVASTHSFDAETRFPLGVVEMEVKFESFNGTDFLHYVGEYGSIQFQSSSSTSEKGREASLLVTF